MLNKDNYRYERKFIVSAMSKYEIETMIKLHPAMFFEAYPQRCINNLYFDSFDMKNYYDSADGIRERLKIRIRWYGELFGIIEKPILEIKIKNGLVGKKETYWLNPFIFDENLKRDAFLNVLKKSKIPEQLKLKLNSSEFALLNRYIRRYFESADRRFRLTIDSEITYCQLKSSNNNFLNKSFDHINTIVELKYGPNEDSYAEQISNYFPFRMTKISKYVDGVAKLYH